MENFNDAIKSLQKKFSEGKIIPVIGAGFSKPFNLPSWGELLIDVAQNFGADDNVIKTIQTIIENQDYVSAVSTVTSATRKTTIDIQNAVVEIIKEKKNKLLNEKNVSDFSNLGIDNNYVDLWRFNTLLTLNYDEIIADFNKGYAGYTISKFRKTGDIGSKKYIIYIHGKISNPESIVLAKADYMTAYESDDFKTKLGSFVVGRTFLFMGFSFQDEYMKKFVKTFTSNLDVLHYALLDKTSIERLGKEKDAIREQYNVEIIPYDDSSHLHTEKIRKFIRLITQTENQPPLTYFDGSNKKGHIHSSYQLELEDNVSKLVGILSKTSKNFRVLEVGSGAGHTAIRIADENKRCFFDALDQSKEKIERARKSKKENTYENIEFILDDIQSFVENESKMQEYNFIYLLYSFHHIRDCHEDPDPEQGQGRDGNKKSFLRNCFNNMKSGSYLCIADLFYPDDTSDDEEELEHFFDNRAKEGKASVFWDTLKKIESNGIIDAQHKADDCYDSEYAMIDGILERKGEYLVTMNWLSGQAEDVGFSKILSEKVNSIGDAIILLKKE